MSDFETRIKELQGLIANAKHIAFFGGAGVSTESGIPDFRSKDGLYNQKDINFDKYEPEFLLSHSCLYNKKSGMGHKYPNIDTTPIFYEFYRQKLDCRTIEPNITHKKLAELEEKGKRVSIITQNIDGLHQKAGSKEVYEIHGTTYKNYCDKCGKIFDKNYIFECDEDVPHCECGGLIRPAVTLYEESLPTDFDKASEVLIQADLLIVAGTSLTVYPAANLIQYYHGDKIVMINRDSTPKDSYMDLIFRESLGDVFSKL